jgi:purine-binding chemotaxis protein CheW
MNNGPSQTYILFEVAGATYALPSEVVRQMEMVDHITPVPNAPPYVDGLIFTRGQVVPALNLRRRFGMEGKAHDLRTRLIVLSHEGRTVALIADSAREFVSIAGDALRPPPDTLVGPAARYLRGIVLLGERLVFILDVERVLAVDESAHSASTS